MIIAVINFSGNVGKTTTARHLLSPRLNNAEVIPVESINADTLENEVMLRGKEYGALQRYLATLEHAVVDVGASNIEDFISLMQEYRGSHEEFDLFIVPTVPPLKQQRDTVRYANRVSQAYFYTREIKKLKRSTSTSLKYHVLYKKTGREQRPAFTQITQ